MLAPAQWKVLDRVLGQEETKDGAASGGAKGDDDGNAAQEETGGPALRTLIVAAECPFVDDAPADAKVKVRAHASMAALREQWPYNDAELSRLLHRLHAWKAGKAQREVVLVCGTASLHCGVETDIIRDDPNLASAAERTMKQLVAGPVSDMPHEFICELEGSIDQNYHFMYRHRRVLERRCLGVLRIESRKELLERDGISVELAALGTSAGAGAVEQVESKDDVDDQVSTPLWRQLRGEPDIAAAPPVAGGTAPPYTASRPDLDWLCDLSRRRLEPDPMDAGETALARHLRSSFATVALRDVLRLAYDELAPLQLRPSRAKSSAAQHKPPLLELPHLDPERHLICRMRPALRWLQVRVQRPTTLAVN